MYFSGPKYKKAMKELDVQPVSEKTYNKCLGLFVACHILERGGRVGYFSCMKVGELKQAREYEDQRLLQIIAEEQKIRDEVGFLTMSREDYEMFLKLVNMFQNIKDRDDKEYALGTPSKKQMRVDKCVRSALAKVFGESISITLMRKMTETLASSMPESQQRDVARALGHSVEIAQKTKLSEKTI
uniref:uncharacterized protein LOC120346987 n=1 Tax=Styela clava TaxID=7725 RepID=UPI0019395E93|nr:uncharacterized protein LOC120346987 [Styela clava]